MIEEPPALRIRKDFIRPSAEQISAFRNVPTGFICDAMNGTGALDARICPVNPELDPHLHIVGPALVADNGPADILATLAAVELAEPGDIIMAAVGGFQENAAAGDQVMGMLKNAGAAGFVTDGPMRDIEGILSVGLPAWCTGLTPNSPYANGPGSVGLQANIGGMTVVSGDLIIADSNGVVVVPFSRIDQVINTLQKVRELEETLEAKVNDGFRSPLDLDTMIESGRAVIET